MTTPFVTLVAFVLVIGALVFVHELGHFCMAKLFRVRVFEFALGFPPRVASVEINNTAYSINALPFGGYVKMMGENGDDAENPASFGAKPWWQRAIILAAGPCMNLLLAFLLFFVTAAWLGSPVGTNVVNSTASRSPAQKAGIRSGDIIVAVDHHRTGALIGVSRLTQKHLGEELRLTILRHGHSLSMTVVPRKHPPTGQGAIGITSTLKEQRYSLRNSVQRSFEGVGMMVMAVPNLISSIGHHGTRDVSGPVGIARLTGQSASDIPQYGIGQFFAFVALLSANLGVLNVLPIPALDGGRLVFVLISGIRRRNLNPQFEGLVHLVGMAVLLLLMALFTYQDIARWISGQ